VGICLALAGAEVLLSDQPHITPLAELNMQVGGWVGKRAWLRILAFALCSGS
jgi:hypothetical protein